MNQKTISACILSVGLIITAFIISNGGAERGPGTKTFDVVMKDNLYNPSEIIASVGDKVIINFENRDSVAHAVALPQFNATVPGGHIQPKGKARMEFVANRVLSADAAVCGGARANDKADGHGEDLVVKII